MDNSLYALNPNGTKKWEYKVGTGYMDSISSSPAIGSDGTIYFGSFNDKFYALSSNGTKKWEFITGGAILSSPAIGSDGTIYFGSYDNRLYALDSSGEKIWEFVTGDKISWNSPNISSDGTVYIGSHDGYFYALKSDSQGVADSPWPKFHQNIKNTGRVPSTVDYPPSVSITSPSDGDTVSEIVNIQAFASDDGQVSKVEFYIDDELKSTDTISPYVYSWDTALYSNGTHKIKVTAYDNISQTNSHEISITVDNNFTISGSVKDSGGQGIEGVTVSFSNEGGTASTESSGNYSHTVSYGWSGIATPSKTGYAFSPTDRTYSNITSDQTDQDYTATLLTYTISGSVNTGEATGEMEAQAGLGGAVMSGLPSDPQTDTDGNYSASVDYGWSGTVTLRPKLVTVSLLPLSLMTRSPQIKQIKITLPH